MDNKMGEERAVPVIGRPTTPRPGQRRVRPARLSVPKAVGLGVVALLVFFAVLGSPGGRQAAATAPAPVPGATAIGSSQAVSCVEVERARRLFQIEVLEYDHGPYGTEEPRSDRVVLRITNGSGLTLGWLTAVIERVNASGVVESSSRAPSIPAQSVAPGDTVTVSHLFRGRPGWPPAEVRVFVEDVIPPDVRHFFDELEGCL